MNYKFNPESFGYLPWQQVSEKLAGHVNKYAYAKVVCSHDGSFWYSSCTKMHMDDRWEFESGLYSPYGYSSCSRTYMGCITSKEFAEQLLIHLLGTTTNEGTIKYGTERMTAPAIQVKD